MQHMYSYELWEQFKSGRKEFSGIQLQFCEFNDKDFTGLVIKNSKIDYTQFRFANLKNAKFINCDMFFVSFFGADMENTVFDNCKIEATRFDSAQFKNTKILRSSLSYCLLINANEREMNFEGSQKFKVFTDLDISNEDIIEALAFVGAHLEDLPFEIKSEINKRLADSMKDLNKDARLMQLSAVENKPYGSSASNYRKVLGVYQALDALSDKLAKYGSSREIYKVKKKYGN